MELPVRAICGHCGRSRDSELVGSHPFGGCPECGFAQSSTVEPARASSESSGDSATLRELEFGLILDASGNSNESRAAAREAIGRFQLRDLLGGGGFGQVYRAYDARLDRDVALKVLRDLNPSGRVLERFFREARAAARLDHPGIVTLHDAGRNDGRCWIAYQFVCGPPLSRLMDARSLVLKESVRIVRDLARALDHAHGRGVYHRDLKPANVLLDDEGHPRLTDFGLARRVDFDPTMTRDGAILGTPAYMSPEQAAGRSHQADARSDLYSLGVIFYELLTHDRPTQLPSSAPGWCLEQEAPSTPLSVRRANARVPRAIERICLRALASNPEDRYPSARQFADDLDRWIRGRRISSRWIGILLTVGALVGSAAGFAWGRHPRELPITVPRLHAGGTNDDPPRRIIVRPTTPSNNFLCVTDPSSAGLHIFHRPSCEVVRRTPANQHRPLAAAPSVEDRNFYPCSFCCEDLLSRYSEKGDGTN